MQTQRDNGPDWGGPFREARQHFQVFTGLVQIVSAPLTAWTRKFGTWGERYAGFQMVLGWLLIPVAAAFAPRDDPGPLVLFWFATTLMLMLHRAEGVRLRRRGYAPHSRYSGVSRVPGDEWFAKGTVEPLLAILAGIFACLVCPPLGGWLITAGICQGFAVGLSRDEERARIRSMRDARAQALYDMELLRREVEGE